MTGPSRSAPITLCAALLAAVLCLAPSATKEPPARAQPMVGADYEVLDQLDLAAPLAGVAVRAGRGGHFYLKAHVNGRSLPFLVDTGASYVTLNHRDARKAGISLPRKAFKHEVRTANGRAKVAAVRLRSVRFKSIHVRNVVALVTQPGAMNGVNLLGNSFLSKLRSFKVVQGKLIMR